MMMPKHAGVRYGSLFHRGITARLHSIKESWLIGQQWHYIHMGQTTPTTYRRTIVNNRSIYNTAMTADATKAPNRHALKLLTR